MSRKVENAFSDQLKQLTDLFKMIKANKDVLDAGVFEQCDPDKLVTFTEQIEHLTDTLKQFMVNLGAEVASEFLSESALFISLGAGDYLVEYLSKAQSNQFNTNLAAMFKEQLKLLHAEGATEIVVIGLAVPDDYLWRGENDEDISNKILEFNALTRSIVEELNKELPDAHMSFMDIRKTLLLLLQKQEAHDTLMNKIRNKELTENVKAMIESVKFASAEAGLIIGQCSDWGQRVCFAQEMQRLPNNVLLFKREFAEKFVEFSRLFARARLVFANSPVGLNQLQFQKFTKLDENQLQFEKFTKLFKAKDEWEEHYWSRVYEWKKFRDESGKNIGGKMNEWHACLVDLGELADFRTTWPNNMTDFRTTWLRWVSFRNEEFQEEISFFYEVTDLDKQYMHKYLNVVTQVYPTFANHRFKAYNIDHIRAAAELKSRKIWVQNQLLCNRITEEMNICSMVYGIELVLDEI